MQGVAGFHNEGDNETRESTSRTVTRTVAGLLNRQAPHPFSDGWRVLRTQQPATT
jgi:hypothetical protein